MIHLDVFEAEFRYSFGYWFVFGSLLIAFIGMGCTIFTNENKQATVYTVGLGVAYFQVNWPRYANTMRGI